MARKRPDVEEMRERLIVGRKVHGLSRDAVAYYLELTERTIQRFEDGGNPSIETYMAIADVLEKWDTEYKKILRDEEAVYSIHLINAKRKGLLDDLDFSDVPGLDLSDQLLLPLL